MPAACCGRTTIRMRRCCTRIDASGRAMPVTIAGADVRDWEDLATDVAACAPAARAVFISPTSATTRNRASASRSTRCRCRRRQHVDKGGRRDSRQISRSSARRGSTAGHEQDRHLRHHERSSAARLPFSASQNAGETGTLALFRTLNEKGRITGAAARRTGAGLHCDRTARCFVYSIDDFVKGRQSCPRRSHELQRAARRRRGVRIGRRSVSRQRGWRQERRGSADAHSLRIHSVSAT